MLVHAASDGTDYWRENGQSPANPWGPRAIIFILMGEGNFKVPLLQLAICSRSGWRRGVVVSGVRRMNGVNVRWARLVLGWVTVFGRVYHLGM